MRCDEGYDCDICGKPVEAIVESELYLRYVLGDIPLEMLHRHPERHIRCNPSLAQYIIDEQFAPIVDTGPFAKVILDATFVAAEEKRVTAGYRRLLEIPTLGVNVLEYPL